MNGLNKSQGSNQGGSTEIRQINIPERGDNFSDSYNDILSVVEKDTVHFAETQADLPEPSGHNDALVGVAETQRNGSSQRTLHYYDGNTWVDTLDTEIIREVEQKADELKKIPNVYASFNTNTDIEYKRGADLTFDCELLNITGEEIEVDVQFQSRGYLSEPWSDGEEKSVTIAAQSTKTVQLTWFDAGAGDWMDSWEIRTSTRINNGIYIGRTNTSDPTEITITNDGISSIGNAINNVVDKTNKSEEMHKVYSVLLTDTSVDYQRGEVIEFKYRLINLSPESTVVNVDLLAEAVEDSTSGVGISQDTLHNVTIDAYSTKTVSLYWENAGMYPNNGFASDDDFGYDNHVAWKLTLQTEIIDGEQVGARYYSGGDTIKVRDNGVASISEIQPSNFARTTFEVGFNNEGDARMETQVNEVDIGDEISEVYFWNISYWAKTVPDAGGARYIDHTDGGDFKVELRAYRGEVRATVTVWGRPA